MIDILNDDLITGGHGMIGKQIGFGIKPTSLEMNITNPMSIQQYTSKLQNISCIIHLAAINIRESCDNPSKSIDVNINGTTEMLKIAMNRNIPFILISTGAVFSSTNPNEKFNENTMPSPNCMYGNTKSSSESVSLLYNKTIIIRTGWVFGGNQKTHYKFVENAINSLVANTYVSASDNFYGSPTYIFDFIDEMKNIILGAKYGIHHVVNDGFANGYEIAVVIANKLNKPLSLIHSMNNDKIPNSGPSRSNTEILISNKHSPLRNWKEALNEYIEI